MLGGYLGAGKTTVLNHAIRHASGRRLAVLVNDIGSVNVDAALIADHDGRTMSLSNGCVCCSIADDLGPALEEIRSLPEPPDHVVMELSGVAEPARVAPWGDTAGFRLDGVVVAVDADQYVDLAARADIGDSVRAQVAAADLLLLTKTDLAADGGERARARLQDHADAPVLPVVDGVLDLDVLLGVGASRAPSPPGHDASSDHGYRVSTRRIGPVTRAELSDLVAGLPASVLRAKGIVRCVDVEHAVEVAVVGRRRGTRARPDLRLEHDAPDDVVVVVER